MITILDDGRAVGDLLVITIDIDTQADRLIGSRWQVPCSNSTADGGRNQNA